MTVTGFRCSLSRTVRKGGDCATGLQESPKCCRWVCTLMCLLSDAVAARDEAKRLLAGGINPSEARKAQKREQASKFGNTFEGIAREWYEKRIDRWSSSYAEEMIETFEKDVFPYIGGRPIAEIKPMELLAVLSRLNDRGATEKLRKVRQRCGEVFRYAIITGRAEYNPAPDLVSAFAPHKRALRLFEGRRTAGIFPRF